MTPSSIILSVDFVTRQVAPVSPFVVPISGDLSVAFSFTGIKSDGTPGAIAPTLTNAWLTIKERDSGEVLITSTGFAATYVGGISSTFRVHLPLSGLAYLAAMLDDPPNLLGELTWQMANPYSVGPDSIVSRSADFSILYG